MRDVRCIAIKALILLIVLAAYVVGAAEYVVLGFVELGRDINTWLRANGDGLTGVAVGALAVFGGLTVANWAIDLLISACRVGVAR